MESAEPGRAGGSGSSDGGSLGGAVTRSWLWAFAGQAAALLATLIAGPFLIRALGPSDYGLWALLASALTYLQLADAGMAVTSTRFASERFAATDREGEAATIWGALAITGTLTLLAAGVAALLAPMIVREAMHVAPAERGRAALAVRLVCVAGLGAALAGTINTPQQVRLQWRSLTLASSGPAVLETALAPLVLFGVAGGVVTLAALAALAAVASVALNARLALRLLPELRRPRRVAGGYARMIRYGGALAIAAVATVPLQTAERFFLAGARAPREVAYYAVAATLAGILAIIPAAVTQPLIPALARLSSAGLTEEHGRLYGQAMLVVFVVATPATLALAFAARPFLELWAGPAYAANSSVPLYIMLGGLWVAMLAYVPIGELLATGGASTYAAILVGALVPYMALAAVLASAYGTIGAAVSASVRVMVTGVIFFAVVARRHGGIRMPRAVIPAVAAVALLALAMLAAASLSSALVVRMAVAGALLTAYAAATWRTVLSDAERGAVGARLRDAWR
jgi:O-antigen/teichoic acid export membrane protein